MSLVDTDITNTDNTDTDARRIQPIDLGADEHTHDDNDDKLDDIDLNAHGPQRTSVPLDAPHPHDAELASPEHADVLKLLDSLGATRAALDTSTRRCAELESELARAHAKAKDDEEAISMLRSKVEESR